MGALADEVQWHRWAVCNTLGFATDGEMIRGNAVLRISREMDAVHLLRWTWDTRREASLLTARVSLTDPFAVIPGMVAMVDDEAPVSGRWLVESIDVDPAQSNIAEIVFRRPGAKLLEPAPELKLRKESKTTIGGKGDYGVFGEGGEDDGADGAIIGDGTVAQPLAKVLGNTNRYSSGYDGIDLISMPNAVIYAMVHSRVIDVRGGGWWGKSPTGNVALGDGIIQLEVLEDVGPFKKGMHLAYGHAEKATVRVGQVVRAGDPIGRAGFANAWHIHFMVNGGGSLKGVGDRDPLPFYQYAMRHGRR